MFSNRRNHRPATMKTTSRRRGFSCERLEARRLLCADIPAPVDVDLATAEIPAAIARADVRITRGSAAEIAPVDFIASTDNVESVDPTTEASSDSMAVLEFAPATAPVVGDAIVAGFVPAGGLVEGAKTLVGGALSSAAWAVRGMFLFPMGGAPSETHCDTCNQSYDSEFFPAHFNDDHDLLEDVELDEEDLQRYWPIADTGQSVDPISNPDKFAYLHEQDEPATCGTALIDRPTGWSVDPLDAIFAQIEDVGYYTSDPLDWIERPR